MKEKSVIRKTMLKKRDEMDPELAVKLSRIICEKIMRLQDYEKAKTVYAYAARGNEANLKTLIQDAWRKGKKVAVPRIHGDDLDFYYIESFGQLREGYKGIPEPFGCRKAESEDAFMVMPGAAFDEKRNRIGQGKGFYDRYLEKHPLHPTAAAAYEFQVAGQELPHEDTDLRPGAVVTDKRIIR
jgi:5-formyltetrahydrofolate cyclo-ligase